MIMLLLIILALTGCSSVKTVKKSSEHNNSISQIEFSFDASIHTFVDERDGGDRFFARTIKDMENRARGLTDESNKQVGTILVCEVAGMSINRIIEPSEEDRDKSKVYGLNHVLTPVKIKKVIFTGKDVRLEEDDVLYLVEPFFYVTEETGEYYKAYGMNSIVADEYDPIEFGKTYVMYLSYYPSEIYDFDGKTTLGTLGLRESVYCISDDAPSNRASSDPIYTEIWQEVKSKYGNI